MTLQQKNQKSRTWFSCVLSLSLSHLFSQHLVMIPHCSILLFLFFISCLLAFSLCSPFDVRDLHACNRVGNVAVSKSGIIVYSVKIYVRGFCFLLFSLLEVLWDLQSHNFVFFLFRIKPLINQEHIWSCIILVLERLFSSQIHNGVSSQSKQDNALVQ